MRTVLICPVERPGVRYLQSLVPLALTPCLGRTVLEHWLDHVTRLGATDVLILAADRPDQVRVVVGDGARWGLRLTIMPEMRELTIPEARAKYQGDVGPGGPDEVVVIDHLPGSDQRLFDSYAELFAALRRRLHLTTAGDRIGLRELRPGVWVGLHARISRAARLQPPCWIGNDVRVGPKAVIGPMAILEDRSFVETGAVIQHSLVAPDTFVGKWTELLSCVAFGRDLINARLQSCLRVPDPFLLSYVREQPVGERLMRWLGRVAAMVLLEVTLPIGLYAMCRSTWTGKPAFRPGKAVRPTLAGTARVDSVLYYVMRSNNRWLQRWPQLWNVACGEFSWVGNRPLKSRQAADLSNDFERMWLNAPIGLVSLADVQGCFDEFNDATRAHASFYAAYRSLRLDWEIVQRFTHMLLGRAVAKGQRELTTAVKASIPEQGSITTTP